MAHPEDSLIFTKTPTHYELKATMWLPRPVEEVWPFFSDAANLERLTPPWLKFNIITPQPIKMQVGTLIDYKIKVRGMPLRWRTRIAEWQPPHKFVDEQLRGPYRLWHHTHTFEPVDGGTLATDRVAYRVPGGALVHNLMVKRDIETIFNYRQEQLRALFG